MVLYFRLFLVERENLRYIKMLLNYRKSAVEATSRMISFFILTEV
jgi:hypothetical protein